MITLAKVRDSFVEKGKMIIKALTLKGASTAKQIGSFGIDSNPIDNYTAIYADTTNINESVIIGYINKHYITEKGEIRIYSLDSNSTVKSYVYAKKDGNLELNGNAFSGVRFENLEIAINNNNTLINAELLKIATAIATLGGTYTFVPVSTNLENTKSESVRLK
jgi:hypothetical protein